MPPPKSLSNTSLLFTSTIFHLDHNSSPHIESQSFWSTLWRSLLALSTPFSLLLSLHPYPLLKPFQWLLTALSKNTKIINTAYTAMFNPLLPTSQGSPSSCTHTCVHSLVPVRLAFLQFLDGNNTQAFFLLKTPSTTTIHPTTLQVSAQPQCLQQNLPGAPVGIRFSVLGNQGTYLPLIGVAWSGLWMPISSTRL